MGVDKSKTTDEEELPLGLFSVLKKGSEATARRMVLIDVVVTIVKVDQTHDGCQNN